MTTDLSVGASDKSTGQAVYLVSPDKAAEMPGKSLPVELGALAGRRLLIILRITAVIEQESLEVSLWGSADGSDWGSAPLFRYPQKFYRGIAPATLDLHQRPELRFLQARWITNRWGRGNPRPHFRFSVELQTLEP